MPFNETQTMAGVAAALHLDVIQVVGIKLGCLNHTLLTTESISAHGLTQTGWIANHLSQSTKYALENIDALRLRISAPCLGEISFHESLDVNNIANELNLMHISNLGILSNT